MLLLAAIHQLCFFGGSAKVNHAQRMAVCLAAETLLFCNMGFLKCKYLQLLQNHKNNVCQCSRDQCLNQTI